MISSDIAIGRNVLELRGDRSQQSVADAMRERGWRWSQATVWGVEKGERPLRLAEAVDLAAVLGVRLGQLTAASRLTMSLLEAHLQIAESYKARAELRAAAARFAEAQISASEWNETLAIQVGDPSELDGESEELFYETRESLQAIADIRPMTEVADQVQAARTADRPPPNPLPPGKAREQPNA